MTCPAYITSYPPQKHVHFLAVNLIRSSGSKSFSKVLLNQISTVLSRLVFDTASPPDQYSFK